MQIILLIEKIYLKNSTLYLWSVLHFFQMIISCNPNHYNVFVNGKQVHTYNHRFTSLDKIDVLEVTGDLSLIDVNV